MFNFRVLADLSADFIQRTEEPPRASNESSIYEQANVFNCSTLIYLF